MFSAKRDPVVPTSISEPSTSSVPTIATLPSASIVTSGVIVSEPLSASAVVPLTTPIRALAVAPSKNLICESSLDPPLICSLPLVPLPKLNKSPSALKLPVTFTGLFRSQLVVLCTYVIVALAPSTVIPAPLAAELFAAPLASVMFRSSMSSVVELIVVCVPSTCRSPAITTVPVLSPCVAGSIVNVAGPLRYPEVSILPTLIAVLGWSAVSASPPCVESAKSVDALVAAVPKPSVVLAADASASSTRLAPNTDKAELATASVMP